MLAGVTLSASKVSGSSRGFVLLTDTDGKKINACLKCGALIRSSSYLAVHRRRCEGVFICQCHVCDKKFYRKDKLREHLYHQHKILVRKTVDKDTDHDYTRYLYMQNDANQNSGQSANENSRHF